MTLTEERKKLWREYITAVRTKNPELAQQTMHTLSTMISREIINKDNIQDSNTNGDNTSK
ncbi:MAG: hypothetical protein KDH96_02355 [Candidatus Riesia sp.]|nr:hypothetical protein [Candidatus Riesia sp.]